MRIGIALGSNLGDRLANLRGARDAIVDLAADRSSVLVSRVYETEPIDCKPGAEKFLNAVIEIEYDGDPTELLEKLIRIEESLGRDRDHARNVSRKIDIDILYADELVIQNERLQLPHPRVHERQFVLQPLADIRRGLVLPNQNQPVSELLARIQDSTKVKLFAEEW
ncbi:MAG TPA: 2-amino-4-hydroxy-6-hydroxymethyldihydropteridine diphosphokinase [Chthoniobacterales bacterium]|jgi:2-amino-4-hydroxy-6-hydroxymethyldihydropteridine diphosphokinase|nr:2-amino-4-hydroxy-6-hydroxymethyldihydropteridine diphosphokinase [Chthoniobacterales bacterium]